MSPAQNSHCRGGRVPIKLEMYSDGACSGNPGPAGIGVVIKRDGEVLKEICKYIGEATNNIAEYTAIIYAAQEALILKADEVTIFTDSELAYNQIIGQYRVKDVKIKVLFEQVQHLASGFKTFVVTYVPREQNANADKLARKAIKTEQAKVVASRQPPDNAQADLWG